MTDLIDRASRDPDFVSRFAEDPMGVARAEGYDITPDDLRSAIGAEGATDEQVIEQLKARLSHAAGAK
jgi:hypothetical protein